MSRLTGRSPSRRPRAMLSRGSHPFLLMTLLAACGGGAPAGPTTPPATPVEHGSIDAALAGSQRTEAQRARDVHRHPRETLEFFGVAPSSRVVELWPGGGWYTAILAPLVYDAGHLTAVAPQSRYLQG